MAQTKAKAGKKKSSKSRVSNTNRTRAKRQSAAQSRTKRAPSKTVLRQMAKDWDHVT